LSAQSPEFADKAKAHWTPERVAKVTGGKRWPVLPSEAPELLRVLGLLNSDGSMPADALRKFSQINHMLTLLMPQIDDLIARHPVVRVLDAGCGTSYLSLLLAWYVKTKRGHAVDILGIDLNEKVIATSKKRAADLGLTDVTRFEVRGIDADFQDRHPEQSEGSLRFHLVIALHACDTATDAALALAVKQKADHIAVAPCCQAELARKWKDLPDSAKHPLGILFRTPNLRRDTAAQATDAMRMLLLRSRGYEVTATEFVPSEHTPKNRLILATRRGSFLVDAAREFEQMKNALGGQGIALETLL
jgi:SAM-dependent methyltransferase